jgi:RHH-type proline utilization regulon transcriptional repressor/proline dehydrogenase/delta 1-pyrroline-5-carboxylate dehydrogenase
MNFELNRPPLGELRRAIEAHQRTPEAACVEVLLEQASLPDGAVQKVRRDAARLIEAVRAKRTRSGGVDALMREFTLSSDEGVALMCLAEALLRIPDTATRDALIRDKIGPGDWQAHVGQSPSLFVNAAAWGLLITGKLVTVHSDTSLSAALGRLVVRGGEPLIRRGVDLAMRMLGRQFVTGETIEDALDQSEAPMARGYRYSYDMLGEAAMTEDDAMLYLASYRHAIERIGSFAATLGLSPEQRVKRGPGISVKLSALHPRYVRGQRQRVHDELLPRLKGLALQAQEYGIGLNIDAEESERLGLSLELFEALATDPDLAHFPGLGFVIQAYQKRAPYVIDWIVDLARRTRGSGQRRFMVRLVKGAYWDSEIKRAQIEGQRDYPVYTRKVYTDLAYQACAAKLLGASDAIFAQFATHNAYTLAWVREAARQAGVAETDFEFQCLHGMGETLYDQVVAQGALACRIYAPVGSHETLLAYLVRRLLENGANSSFVNRIVDQSVSIDELTADPVAQAQSLGGRGHTALALPPLLYPDGRRNSRGLDWSNELTLASLEQGLAAFVTHRWQAQPTFVDNPASLELRAVRNPANHDDQVGQVRLADAITVTQAIARAQSATLGWAATAAAVRAAALRGAADLLEAHEVELMALAVREAGKSLYNAHGEVREAVDFCRYYAQQIDGAGHTGVSPGAPIVCISPWNFPLAIFVGQVSAALAAGRCVLAKPAEQTPLMAARAVSLLHEAGVPKEVLQLLPGDGETVGAALVQSAAIGGVLFTGSTEVAKIIAGELAARPDEPVLVAETGGQNAMIVDSSALAEQVVQDAVTSAFDSAGQRCSALRVLCIQEELAPRLLDMLTGAMSELRVADPSGLDSDVGPVIDATSAARLNQHVASMRERGHRVYQPLLPAALASGTFVAPTIIEVDGIGEIGGEVFGPILHVLRYRRDEIGALIESIDATGFGLTMGVHSRIEEHIEYVARRCHAGNLYVNRNMVGAVVGVQPFGGEGLSGTGPKAGGPLYLARLGGPLGAELRALQTIPGAERAASVANPVARADPWLTALAQSASLDLASRTKIGGIYEEGLVVAARAALRLTLPGPTGETNELGFVPRARVACLGGDLLDLLAQIAAVRACGARAEGDPARLPPELRFGLAPLTTDVPVEAALVAGEASERVEIQARLAARAGAITPLIRWSYRTYSARDLWRLFHERTISTNTAAAGGNASLMALAE